MWQSITTTARNLDWTINRVSSSEEALECFHKGNAVPAVVFVDCRYQNDKIVDAHQIGRFVNPFFFFIQCIANQFVHIL